MNKIVQMILVLTGIGIVSGSILAFVNNWAEPRIAANQKAATEAAIFRVLPEGEKYEAVSGAGLEVYNVEDEKGEGIGYALVYSGNGFQGAIRLIAGISTDLERMTALEILDQVETPGLGTKVTETPFTDQFKQIQMTPAIICLKNEEPDDPNEIQAITGATISSKAVVAIINNGIKRMRELRSSGGLK